MLLAATDIDVSAGGLVLGLLLGVLCFFLVKLVLDHVPQLAPVSGVIALVLAALVFLVLGFDIHET